MRPDSWSSGARETAAARQRLRKHVFAATYMLTRIEELLEAVFSMRSVPRAYKGT
jgi:hypothetical protein